MLPSGSSADIEFAMKEGVISISYGLATRSCSVIFSSANAAAERTFESECHKRGPIFPTAQDALLPVLLNRMIE